MPWEDEVMHVYYKALLRQLFQEQESQARRSHRYLASNQNGSEYLLKES